MTHASETDARFLTMRQGCETSRVSLGDKLAGDHMATRRGTLVGFPFIERVGNLFDTLQIHYHIDEDRAARGDIKADRPYVVSRYAATVRTRPRRKVSRE